MLCVGGGVGAHPHLGPPSLSTGCPVDIPNPSLASSSRWLQPHSQGQPASRPRMSTPHPLACEHQEAGKRAVRGEGGGCGKSLPKLCTPTCQPLNFSPFLIEPQQQWRENGLN